MYSSSPNGVPCGTWGASIAFSMIMGKKTPISALRECLNLAIRVRKMLQDRAKACGMEDVQFFSRLRHRYCLIAELNFSLVLNTSPLFSSNIISSSRAKTCVTPSIV